MTSAFHNSSVSDSLVVRAVEDASGKFATLQVDHVPAARILKDAAEHPEDGDLQHCGESHGPSYRAERTADK